MNVNTHTHTYHVTDAEITRFISMIITLWPWPLTMTLKT